MLLAAATDLAAHIDDDDRYQRMLAASRATILAGCTEPGNAPVGAPYPQPGADHERRTPREG